MKHVCGADVRGCHLLRSQIYQKCFLEEPLRSREVLRTHACSLLSKENLVSKKASASKKGLRKRECRLRTLLRFLALSRIKKHSVERPTMIHQWVLLTHGPPSVSHCCHSHLATAQRSHHQSTTRMRGVISRRQWAHGGVKKHHKINGGSRLSIVMAMITIYFV